MALAGIELRYLVDHITERARDYYVSNIYGVDKNSVLFKLHHTQKEDLFMMISTSGVWLTGVKIAQTEPNRLLKRLRGDLLRFRLKRIEQKGAERIAYFVFEGFEKEFVVVAEFFGDGNILVCNSEMKILALQHSIDVRHRKLGVGLAYSPPPASGTDVLKLAESDFALLASSDIPSAKWLGRNMGLPKKYVEGIFGIAQIDPGTVGRDLSGAQIAKICEITTKTIHDVVSGNHDAAVTETDALPVRLAEECVPVPSFMEGLDRIFTKGIVERGRSIRSGDSEKVIEELQTRLDEQQRAIGTVKAKSDSISRVANSLYDMVSRGITSIRDEPALAILATNGARLATEKGVPLLLVHDEKIKIDPDSPLQSMASVLFDAAKRQSGATRSIEAAVARTEKKLEEARSKTDAQMRMEAVSHIRKKGWYERYRWFYTSDSMLAIGGRDAPSNSAVVRKHMDEGDKIFHADIFGSPFFILKKAQDLPVSSVNEVAHATVCFSRAWREGMYGVSAYWVNPEQVKKSAPSGEFLPKGSFTIEGQRNFVKTETLRLAVGMIPHGDGHALTCGPPDPIRIKSICYAVIEPGGSEMADAAKKIKIELSKLEDAAKEMSIDDFVRVLPAGKSQIKETGRGDAGA
ncbi:MAG: fibronectin-binding domain-containing protein [Nitrosopumilus sp. H13]|nr:MAG: fibronectin-binding domain-containing protein [Nitrosopumilus sp. H13]